MSVTERAGAVGAAGRGFADFYGDRYDEVVRALAVTLQDEGLARDAAQEGFARCWERWEQVSVLGNPSGWVYRVGLNWARSRLRRWTRERNRVSGPSHQVAGDIALPADRAVIAALRGLSVAQRAVVVLRFWLDWSVEQTATALDVSEGTVKSRQHRALARLAEHLEVDR